MKFKENPICKVAGVVWLIVALLNLGLLIFMLNSFASHFGLLISPILLLTILSGSALGIFYLRIHHVDYIRINEQSLSIHRGLVLRRRIVKLSDVHEGRLVGNKYILILKNEKEVPLYTRNLSIRDLDRLKVNFDKA